jgi:hypothetical protein
VPFESSHRKQKDFTMNPNSQSRSGWLKYALLVVLAGTGLAGGLYLANYAAEDKSTPASEKKPSLSHHRFPLSAADAKERNESPEIAVDSTGRVYLTWASQTGTAERTLFLSRSEDAGRTFAQPQEVARSGIFRSLSQMRETSITRDSKMAPHIAVSGSTVHLAWTESLANNTGLRMVVAASIDQGKTFGPKIQVHQGEGARPTYTALATSANGAILCSWLDNRNKSQQTYASCFQSGKTSFEPEDLVHAGGERGVCPCCPTASLIGPDGACYVAFRNIASGYRDIFIGRKKLGADKFELIPVVPSTWTFNGCPHDGPSLVIVGDTMRVAWMDAHTGPQRCYFGSASLVDMKFMVQDLHHIPVGSQGNAKLCADARGTVHAVWEESGEAQAENHDEHKHDHAAPKIGSGRAIMHATFSAQAKSFSGARPVAAKSGTFQTRPSIAVAGDRVIVAFSEFDESGKSVVVVSFGREEKQ